MLFIVLFGCSENESPIIVATFEVSEITDVSAVSGGEIVYSDGSSLEKGLVWSTSVDPTIETNSGTISFNTKEAEFTTSLEGLIPSTVYHVRAYAIGMNGIAYGDEQSFITYSGRINDVEGNSYYTVTIGSYEWMGNNLRTGRYRNGDIIPFVDADLEWSSLVTGAVTSFKSDLHTDYGNLYNWFSVVDERGLCPAGWDIPTDEEWKILERELGMSASSSNRSGLRDRYAGGILKEKGNNNWRSPNILATDEYGFRALPGGYRSPEGVFRSLGASSNWWTYTGHDGMNSWYRSVYHENAGIYRSIINKKYGISVRCIRKIS